MRSVGKGSGNSTVAAFKPTMDQAWLEETCCSCSSGWRTAFQILQIGE